MSSAPVDRRRAMFKDNCLHRTWIMRKAQKANSKGSATEPSGLGVRGYRPGDGLRTARRTRARTSSAQECKMIATPRPDQRRAATRAQRRSASARCRAAAQPSKASASADAFIRAITRRNMTRARHVSKAEMTPTLCRGARGGRVSLGCQRQLPGPGHGAASSPWSHSARPRAQHGAASSGSARTVSRVDPPPSI